ncbi:MAG: hypothetical protein AB7E27_00990 [Candidatus Methanomethylophilaceae archaeon]
MGEFSLRNGSVGKGIVGMLAAALLFVVIPVSLATLGLHTLNLAIADISSGTDVPFDAESLESLKEVLALVRETAILYAIPIIILAFPKGFYPKGNFGRVPFGILQSLTIALWIWYVTQGGILPIDVEIPLEIVSGVETTATVSLNLILTGFIYLFMLMALAKGGYYFVEFGANRKKYLLRKIEEENPPEEDEDAEGRKPKKKRRSKRSKEDEDAEDWEVV